MTRFRHEHLLARPRGYKVRTKLVGKHRLVLAVPPGRRRMGTAKLLEVLHPTRENPKLCGVAKMNPAELLIFGNPSRESYLDLLRKASKWSEAKISKEMGPAFDKKRVREELRRLRNPGGAETLYEEFHQDAPREALAYDEPQAMPRSVAALGDLEAIGFGTRTADGEDLHGEELASRWKKCSHVSFAGDDVKLGANAGGTQLYLVGGDQALDRAALDSMDAKRAGDRWHLGPAAFIVYNTRKGADNFEFSGYTHEFGEEGGRRPTVYYDPETRRILLRGGSYRIEDRGIVN